MYIAVVLRQVIQHYVDHPVTIKWPNDIIINDKKVAGILIQNLYSGSQLSSSIIGIGVNVNQETFDESLPYATSLRQVIHRYLDREEILYRLVSTLDQQVITESMLKNSDTILNLYNNQLYKKGEIVTCMDKEANTMQGQLSHVDKNGDLNLHSNGALLKLPHGHYRLAVYQG